MIDCTASKKKIRNIFPLTQTVFLHFVSFLISCSVLYGFVSVVLSIFVHYFAVGYHAVILIRQRG
jgi:hypothetical protein